MVVDVDAGKAHASMSGRETGHVVDCSPGATGAMGAPMALCDAVGYGVPFMALGTAPVELGVVVDIDLG